MSYISYAKGTQELNPGWMNGVADMKEDQENRQLLEIKFRLILLN